ncbi:MAG: hypothetical protein ACP5D9_19410 [Mariniphaga sp.]
MTQKELQEIINSWENLELTIHEITKNPGLMPVLMDLALYGSEPKSWRAAWLADKIHEKNPQLLIPWLDQMIEALQNDLPPGKKRHFLKLISLNKIEKKHFLFLMDCCLNTFTSWKEPVAVRVHAMQVLFNISEAEPDFKPELLTIIQHEMELHPSAGIRSRGKKLVQQLRHQIRKSQL